MPPSLADLTESLRDRYRVERELGSGGMATVYLAEDVKHRRKVALKVLRAEVSAVIGAARFLHEIQTTANLHHPHILPLHDSGEVLGTAFYVMPYVDGESLRARLLREKQLPIDAVIRIATEVASALDYAHRQGVVHRDIKPENILLRDGQAFVSDFGIALATAAAGGRRMTQTGLSMGTPNYMSPEQAMGDREITARSDVYALGSTVYEMLTGDPPFTGSTAQAVVARVVTETPRPLVPQRATIPPHIEAAVLTALQKLPADRFASAGEFALALATPGTRTVLTASPAPLQQRRRLGWAVGAGALALLVAAGLAYYRPGAGAAPRTLVAALLPPPGCEFTAVENGNIIQLSPDGQSLAFSATCGGEVSLWVRQLETGETQRLGGTAEAEYPFWSPDGRSLAFFAGDSLKRIDLESGAIRNLASSPNGRGGSWSMSGTIVYAPDVYGPLYQVAAAGGEPAPATTIDDSVGSVSHRLPHFLPDGRRFLFARGTAEVIAGEVHAGELGSLETRKVLDGASNVAYAEGHLLFARDGVLLAQPFDPESQSLSGGAVAIAPGIEGFDFRYVANFSAAPGGGGRMVYREPPVAERRMEWFAPATGARVSAADPGAYGLVRVSPDGRRVLVSRPAGRGRLVNVWLYDPDQATWSRVSQDSRLEYAFVWSHDGQEAILQPSFDSIMRFVSIATGETRALVRPLTDNPILDWAPDGSYAVGRRQVEGTGFDLVRWTPASPGSEPVPLLATPSDEIDPRISPDGRYLAYLSDQSGRSELFLARLPGMTGQVQVSTAGVARTNLSGAHVWSPDGRRLYYLDRTGTLVSVPVVTSPELRLGKPAAVTSAPRNIRAFDAAPDGRLLLLYDDRPAQAPATLLDGWTVRLERR